MPDNYGMSRGVFIKTAKDVLKMAKAAKPLSTGAVSDFAIAMVEDDDDTYFDKLETTKNVPYVYGGPLRDVTTLLLRAQRASNEEAWAKGDQEVSSTMRAIAINALKVAAEAHDNADKIIKKIESYGKQDEPKVKGRLEQFRVIRDQNAKARERYRDFVQQEQMNAIRSVLGG